MNSYDDEVMCPHCLQIGYASNLPFHDERSVVNVECVNCGMHYQVERTYRYDVSSPACLNDRSLCNYQFTKKHPRTMQCIKCYTDYGSSL